MTHVAHHFDSAAHQHHAAKLGMWLFLATEVLLFGGLFTMYAVLRANHPELFRYGSSFLDAGWGAINTLVLIVSSLTMALAVWCAQRGHQRELIIFLALTLLCAVDFLGVKYIEYRHKFHEHLVWGTGFYQLPDGVTIPQTYVPAALAPGDASAGALVYRTTCAACHGLRGEGLPSFGRALDTSTLVRDGDDDTLLRFLQAGRAADDPQNTTGIAMLPRGGNDSLTDQDLLDVAAHVRTLLADDDEDAAADVPMTVDELLASAGTVRSEPARGPPGFTMSAPVEALETPDPRLDPQRPANAHLFFSLYFVMTGLHGLHVIIGMIVIVWLMVRAHRGHFSVAYNTPVDLGGLYWHIVDVIWIFLFPLLYLT